MGQPISEYFVFPNEFLSKRFIVYCLCSQLNLGPSRQIIDDATKRALFIRATHRQEFDKRPQIRLWISNILVTK